MTKNMVSGLAGVTDNENTSAYYTKGLITAARSFIAQARVLHGPLSRQEAIKQKLIIGTKEMNGITKRKSQTIL
jgi:hypothetical protein